MDFGFFLPEILNNARNCNLLLFHFEDWKLSFTKSTNGEKRTEHFFSHLIDFISRIFLASIALIVYVIMSNISVFYSFDFDKFCSSFYELNNTSQTVYQCALITILVLGLLANSAVISLVITVRDLRNTSNVFISVLCGANILMLVTFLPLELIDHNSKTLHHTSANLKNFALSFLCCVSVYTLVLLSYERWCAVVRPVVTTAKGTGWKLIGMLVLSGALSVPNAFLFRSSDGEESKSKIAATYFNIMAWYLFVVMYAFPLGIIMVLYASLALTLLSQNKMLRESVKRNPKTRIRRNKVAWVAIGLVVSFAVCWLPFHIYGFLNIYAPTCPPASSLVIVENWRMCIYMLNTCTDPLSVFVLGSRFRRHLCSCLSCLFVPCHMRRQNDRRYSSTSSRSTSATQLKAFVLGSSVKPHVPDCT